MGVTGIDWSMNSKWARSLTSSMTLNHDVYFIDGDVYNNMEIAGLLATSNVSA